MRRGGRSVQPVRRNRTIVAGGVPPPIITDPGSFIVTVGVFFSFQIIASNTTEYITIFSFPPGISMNSVTGLISGTPIEVANEAAQIKAKGPGGESAPLTIFFQVSSFYAPLGPPELPTVVVNS